MTEPTTTWSIPPAAWIMVGLAVSAEATSNALRAYDLGSHLERLSVTFHDIRFSLAGAVLVLAAIAVSLSQTRAAWVALTPGDKRQRIVSGIAACLLLSISITAMASHILSAQRAKSGAETKSNVSYHDTKKLYDDADAELKKVRNAKTSAEAQAALDAAKTTVDANVWRRTKGCTDVTTRASTKECRPYLEQIPALEAALAQSKRKAELESKLPALKADLDRQHLTDAASDSEAGVSFAWAWIMGLGVVMIATFGPAIFAKVETVSSEQTFSEIKVEALANIEPSPLVEMFSGPFPEPPKPGKRKPVRKLPKGVVDFRSHPVVKALKENGGSVSSNRALARLMNVTDGESSKRVQEIEDLLEICKVGKEMRIALKA